MLTTVIATVIAAQAVSDARSARAQATAQIGGLSSTALDSVMRALSSPDWNERHGALVRINEAYPSAVPGPLVAPLLSLLGREVESREEHAGDEGFGEYLVDLVLTGVQTGDARAIPAILALDGLGVSSGVAAFVASRGPAVMPLLDAHARTREDRASDVLEAYALMYARYGSHLTRSDSARVLRRLLAAAADTSINVRLQLSLVAPRGPIGELLPAVAELAASDPGQMDGAYIVRLNAASALPTLQRAQATLPTADLLNRLTLLTAAACDGAGGQLYGECTALAAHLATAVRAVEQGQPQTAASALDAYRRAAQRLGADGLLPRLTAVTLDGTAQAVAARL